MTRLLVVIILGGILCIGLLSCKGRTILTTRIDSPEVVSPDSVLKDSSMDGNLIARGSRYYWIED